MKKVGRQEKFPLDKQHNLCYNKDNEMRKETTTMLTNLTKYALRNLSGYRDYKIINKHEVTTTVTHPIPYTTGYTTYRSKEAVIPDYLKGFEKYYDVGHYSLRLKPEYRFNRPTYTIDVKHTLYDVELTKLGVERVQECAKYYQRMAQEYTRFLGE